MVVGGTGRLGREVVAELVGAASNTSTSVIAVVRDMEKARDILPVANAQLKVVECDLSQDQALTKVLQEFEPDNALWCAAGFTDSPSTGTLGKLVGALKLKFFPSKVIDITALGELGAYFLKEHFLLLLLLLTFCRYVQ